MFLCVSLSYNLSNALLSSILELVLRWIPLLHLIKFECCYKYFICENGFVIFMCWLAVKLLLLKYSGDRVLKKMC